MCSIHTLAWQRCEVSNKNIPPLHFCFDRHVVCARRVKSAKIACDSRPAWCWLPELPTSGMRVYLRSLVVKNLHLEGITASFFKAEYFIVYHIGTGRMFVFISGLILAVVFVEMWQIFLYIWGYKMHDATYEQRLDNRYSNHNPWRWQKITNF